MATINRPGFVGRDTTSPKQPQILPDFGLPTAGPMAAPPAMSPGVEAPAEPVTPAPPPSTSGGGWGPYMPEGYDSQKVASGHASPKYLIGKTISQFDPSKGITPEVLAALNGLGIGTFAGSGDKVSVTNGDPRFEGVNMIDLVRNFTGDGDKAWQFGAEGGPQAQAASAAPMAATGGGGGFNQSALSALLQGSGTARVADALSKMTADGRGNIDALIQQLQAV